MTSPNLTVNVPVSSTGAVADTANSLAVETCTVIVRITPSNGFRGPEADPAMLTVFVPTTGVWVSGGG